MSLSDLEAIVDLTSPGAGPPNRLRRGWGVSPGLSHAKVARSAPDSPRATASPLEASPVSPRSTPVSPRAAPAAPEFCWTVASKADMVEMLRARQVALDLSNEALEHVSGLTPGHIDKILGPGKVKGLGRISLPALVQALALRVYRVDVNDAAALLALGRTRLNLVAVLQALDAGVMFLHFAQCETRAARMRKRWTKRRIIGGAVKQMAARRPDLIPNRDTSAARAAMRG